MKILVTGAAGFVGSNLVDGLLSAGHEVRALDNFSTGHRANLAHVADEIDLVEGDLRSYERVSWAVRGCEAVFHEGAMPSVPRSVQDPLTSSEINIGGTLNVLLAARDAGVRRVVFASSSSVYGDAPGFPRVETQPTSPLAPYAVSKLAAEQYCRVAHIVYGLETVCLRYFNVFGRRQDPFSQYSAVIPKFITAMRAGVAPTIYGDGTQSRDFTHVDDVVAANIMALDAVPAAGRIYNIAVRAPGVAQRARRQPQRDPRDRARRGVPRSPPRRRQALAGRRRAGRARARVQGRGGVRPGPAAHDRGLRALRAGLRRGVRPDRARGPSAGQTTEASAWWNMMTSLRISSSDRVDDQPSAWPIFVTSG